MAGFQPLAAKFFDGLLIETDLSANACIFARLGRTCRMSPSRRKSERPIRRPVPFQGHGAAKEAAPKLLPRQRPRGRKSGTSYSSGCCVAFSKFRESEWQSYLSSRMRRRSSFSPSRTLRNGDIRL
jgi:hypothetical protein